MFFRRKPSRLEHVISVQFRLILERGGPIDEFQRGYAMALVSAWEQAGLPTTSDTIAVRAIASAAYAPPEDVTT